MFKLLTLHVSCLNCITDYSSELPGMTWYVSFRKLVLLGSVHPYKCHNQQHFNVFLSDKLLIKMFNILGVNGLCYKIKSFRKTKEKLYKEQYSITQVLDIL